MDEEKKKRLEEFQRNVAWLHKSVPRDDIYDFAEQTLMACDFFIYKLGEYVNINDEAEKDEILGQWFRNVVTMRFLAENDIEGIVDVSFQDEEEE